MSEYIRSMSPKTQRLSFIVVGIILFVSISFWLYSMAMGFASLQSRYAFADMGSSAILAKSGSVDFEDSNLYERVDFDEVPREAKSWLYIPGCDVDVPLVQEGSVGGVFYRNHDVNGDANLVGCVAERGGLGGKVGAFRLITASPQGAFSYLSSAFCDAKSACSHPYLYEYTNKEVTRYRLWAVSDVSVEDDPLRKYPAALGSDDYAEVLFRIEGASRFTLFERPSAYQNTLVIATNGDETRTVAVYVADKKMEYDSGNVVEAADAMILYHWMDACDKAREDTSGEDL